MVQTIIPRPGKNNMVVGPFPAPKRPNDVKYYPSKIETIPFSKDWSCSIETAIEQKIRDNEQKAKEEAKLQYLIDNPIDFNAVLCELINLQKEFIEAQVKYKAFPIYPNSNVIEMPKQIVNPGEKYGAETIRSYSSSVKVAGPPRRVTY